MLALIKEIKDVSGRIDARSACGSTLPDESTVSSVSSIFACSARMRQVSRTEGCSTEEVIKCCCPEVPNNCLSTVLLLSLPPLVNRISWGFAPKVSARLSSDSSSKHLASRPAHCGLEGLANACLATSLIACSTASKNGEVAL